MESEESHSSGTAAPAAEHSIEKEAFMSLAHACPHQPLHYSYALTPSRCFGLFCSATAADQLKVEQRCLKCFSDLFPALAPHPSSLSSQIASPGHPQNQQRLQQKGEQGNADDEEGNADMPIEDLEFLWKRAARQVSLHRSRHVAFLTKHLDVPFSEEMMELAASRPWLIYWMVHGLALLEALPRATYADRILHTLERCWDSASGGGWGGGPNQQFHLACTYAAAAALVECGLVGKWLEGEKGLKRREDLYKAILSLKSECGGFKLHRDGEVDMRGAYCAIATASIFQVLTKDLTRGLAEYVKSCQGYDGGIAGEPGLESHGGYSYCGLAALAIIGEPDALDLDALLHWAATKQRGFEGGFQGRTQKLVDSCYSFWLGAMFPLISECLRHLQREYPMTHCFMSSAHLQQYILCCCQAENGGLRDKPGKPPDLYHSCYALSGLSISQYAASRAEFSRGPYVYGCWKSNLLQQTDPFYNVCCTHMQECREQLKQLPRFTAPDTQHAGQEGDLPRLSAELTDKLSRAAINLREDEGSEWVDPESEAESS
ncbi:protein farnesyltranstransferase beta subunit, putative [Eimeria necatrix]|uniref:Protein farnesyltransferase subunit beta n=1 Tax=Eimeria necatrix TaxID=51315 RepID=U6MWB6_9EIME|nr:protein farnesyltranstransferase beta subunit, putative [Eimeria necatrix]CDJ68266.1 protein farnesyltranstransferase beta subunit, putative [Eimeria necatrix]